MYFWQNGLWLYIDMIMFVLQMMNMFGGFGCELGYNYFFLFEYIKVYVYWFEVLLWQFFVGVQFEFIVVYFLCNIICVELFKGYGCINENKKKNNCFEIFFVGGGKWYKGLKINGVDKGIMGKIVKELGWDQMWFGLGGEKFVVCFWFLKG